MADETIQLAQQYNFPLWNIVATLDLGWALVNEGQAQGLAKIQQSKQSMHAVMSGIRLIALETQADALSHLKQFDNALTVIVEAKNIMTTLGDHHVEAEIHRLEGECMTGPSNDRQAEICFNRALSISRTQQAKLFELRATKNLAKLWHKNGKAEEAHGLLETIYKQFTEGHDTADLQQTRDLLKRSSKDS